MMMVSLGVVRSSHAQFTYRLAAGSAMGVMDNPGPQATAEQGDGFATVNGGLQLQYLGRISKQQLAYGLLMTTWLRGSQGSSFNQRLSFSSEIEASPSVQVSAGLSSLLSRLSTADTQAGADPQPAGPRPAGDQRFLTVGARAGLAWQIDGQWRLEQTVDGSLYRTLGGPGVLENKGLLLNLGLGRQWARDYGGVQGRLGGMRTSSTAPDGQPAASTGKSEFVELVLDWRHDWTPEVSQELGGGMLVLRTDQSHLLPAAFAGINWRRMGYALSLRVAQTADYSVFIGTAFQRRAITLRTSLPLNRFETLGLTASANLERDSTVAVASGSIVVFMGQGGLYWRPGDTFSFSLAYLFRDQRASETTTGPSVFSNLRRQSLMFSVDVHYPGER